MTTLQFARLESWALAVVARVEAGARVEDARVELKREWIDSHKAARRLAGHANAARGAEVLWIIGLDEVSGIVGTNPQQLADWWSRVQAGFDGISPSLTDLILHKDGKTLCALVFTTSRAPYVVKNPLFGSAAAGPIALEVPWREGTKVRSATRNDLLQILNSVATLPEIEALHGSGSARNRTDYPKPEVIGVSLWFTTCLYLTPRGDGVTVIPFHRCRCLAVGADSTQRIEDFEISMNHPWQFRGPRDSQPDTATMEKTSSELIAHGPGRCELRAKAEFTEMPPWLKGSALRLTFTLSVVDADLPLILVVQAEASEAGHDELAHWNLAPGG
jgi:hypothetical protein